MLKIKIAAKEDYDPVKNEFITIKEQTLSLEHSLVSLSKWESKWCKPFLSEKEHPREEIIDYIRCMTISQNVDPEVYTHLGDSEIQRIIQYIEAPMTATTITSLPNGPAKKEVLTAEIFYYYMTALNIPFECQKWHLNRLYTLIQVCAIKSNPPQKMGKSATRKYNSSLNAMRRAKLGTKG